MAEEKLAHAFYEKSPPRALASPFPDLRAPLSLMFLILGICLCFALLVTETFSTVEERVFINALGAVSAVLSNCCCL